MSRASDKLKPYFSRKYLPMAVVNATCTKNSDNDIKNINPRLVNKTPIFIEILSSGANVNITPKKIIKLQIIMFKK